MAECVQEKYPAMLEGSGIQGVEWHGGEAQGAVPPRSSIRLASAPAGGFTKRCFDILLSILLLPPAAIVSLPIAFLIAFDGGPPIYGQWRVGWNGKLFRCYKFRSMVAGAEDELQAIFERNPAAHLQWLERFKLENDPRVTPLGRFLRCTSLDEIPQIWNVLRGEMSWVGPRPVILDELAKYGPHVSAYLACRPGVTGLWQIRRRTDTTYDQRVAYDVEYARNRTVAGDVAILCLTIPYLFTNGDRF